MKKNLEVVQKIEKQYVSDECIQVMIPYEDAITVLNYDGILFHSDNESNLYINKYLEDERRKKFPYYNIPTHYSKNFFGKKTTYVNQLFNFEQPNIIIRDGFISEAYVVKDNNNALLINSEMQFNKYTEYMTYDELLSFIAKDKLPNQETHYIYLDGSIPSNETRIFPTEEKIYNHIYKLLKKNVKEFRNYQQDNPFSFVGKYLEDNPWFLNYLEHSIKDIDLSLVDFNICIGRESTLLVIRTNDNNNITIQGIEASFVRKNKFKVDIYNTPVSKYTLEQLKYIPTLNVIKEPKIPLKLNPGVTKQDILEAKRMVKSLRK